MCCMQLLIWAIEPLVHILRPPSVHHSDSFSSIPLQGFFLQHIGRPIFDNKRADRVPNHFVGSCIIEMYEILVPLIIEGTVDSVSIASDLDTVFPWLLHVPFVSRGERMAMMAINSTCTTTPATKVWCTSPISYTSHFSLGQGVAPLRWWCPEPPG